MKTSRRHELQHNELADSLAHWIEKIRPYSRAALALVVAVVAAIFAWGYLAAQSSRKSAEGWSAIFNALGSPNAADELADVAARYSGTQVGNWARISLADVHLDSGTNRLLTDKGVGRDQLRQASTEYRAILLDAREPMLLQRATFGLARAHEALGTPNDLDDARKEYRELVSKWPDSPYAQDAKQRADDLDRASTKEFYDWLARYEPPRSMTNEPGTPGAKPDFLKDPLEGAGVDLPSAIEGSTPLPKFGTEGGPQLGTEPAGDAPAEQPPASEAPPSASAPDAPAATEPAPAAPSDAPPSDAAPPAPEETNAGAATP
ncbi:MAG: tol-pal system YbgF family protein [Pirellulales bacterium]